jgi:hypothetical protein
MHRQSQPGCVACPAGPPGPVGVPGGGLDCSDELDFSYDLSILLEIHLYFCQNIFIFFPPKKFLVSRDGMESPGSVECQAGMARKGQMGSFVGFGILIRLCWAFFYPKVWFQSARRPRRARPGWSWRSARRSGPRWWVLGLIVYLGPISMFSCISLLRIRPLSHVTFLALLVIKNATDHKLNKIGIQPWQPLIQLLLACWRFFQLCSSLSLPSLNCIARFPSLTSSSHES